MIYLVLIAAGLIAVLVFDRNAAIVAGIMIGGIVVTHLIIGQRVCLDCGHQWRV